MFNQSKNTVYFLLTIILLAKVVLAQSDAVNIPKEWQTLAESSNYQQTWRYDDTINFAQKLDKASDLITDCR
jgi:hypothetical protein